MPKPSRKRKLKLSIEQKYRLYEAAVQDPADQVRCFDLIYSDLNGTLAERLREDFCGTFSISTTWVKARSSNSAISIDYDSEPLAQGRTRHYSSLSPDQKKRISIFQQDVRKPTDTQADIVGACNFSFYVFKERRALLDYFQAVLRSIGSNGIIVLEMVGGPGFINTPFKERRTVKHETGREKGKAWFQYVWEQHSFNPINRHGFYSISFKMSDGRKYEQVFKYDWRIWTIPEIRDALLEAGFGETFVYWEKEDSDGDPTGEYSAAEKADNDDTWICYVVGKK